MSVYQGKRVRSGMPWVVVADTSPAGAPRVRRLRLGPSLRLYNHSPSGFEWGYGGSGPAQLALAILLDHATALGSREAGNWAVRHHQAFKWEFVARWPREGFTLTTGEIERWALALVRKEGERQTGGEP